MNKILLLITFLLALVSSNAQIVQKKNTKGKPSYPANEECYCNFTFEFTEFTNYTNNLQQAQRQAWYNGQANLLKEEIEDRIGENYNSLEDAMEDMIYEAFAEDFEAFTLGNIRDSDIQSRSIILDDVEETRVAWRVFQAQRSNAGSSNPQFDLGDLRHNGSFIKNMSIQQANTLFAQYQTQYNSNTGDYDYHNNRIIRNNYLEDNNIFAHYMVGQYMNHWQNKDIYDRVALTTGYLILFFNEWPIPYQIPSNFQGVDFYIPGNYDYSNSVDDLLNNTGLPYETYNQPPFNLAQIKRNYSTTRENLGNLVSDYINQDPDLRNASAGYMEFHNYSNQSNFLLKEFVYSYAQDDPFLNNSPFWQGSPITLQSFDQPNQLFRVRLQQPAINYDLNSFSTVMDAMSNFTNEFEIEGGQIRDMVEANGYNFPSHFTDADIGKLFDFYNTGHSDLGFTFSDYALEHIIEVEDSNNIYGWSLFTDPFKIEALDAILDGGYVDFEEKLIYTESFSNTKAYCVSQLLLDTANNVFRNVMSNFNSNSNPVKLRFDYAPIYIVNPNSGKQSPDYSTEANTSPIDQNGIITITFNSFTNSAFNNTLEIAANLMHEGIHAQLFRVLQGENNVNNPLPQYQYNYMLDLLEFYENNGSPNFINGNAQHAFMSNYHVTPIANAIRSLDNDRYTLDHYLSFAWEGLFNIGSSAQPPLVTQTQMDNYYLLSNLPLYDQFQLFCDD